MGESAYTVLVISPHKSTVKVIHAILHCSPDYVSKFIKPVQLDGHPIADIQDSFRHILHYCQQVRSSPLSIAQVNQTTLCTRDTSVADICGLRAPSNVCLRL